MVEHITPPVAPPVAPPVTKNKRKRRNPDGLHFHDSFVLKHINVVRDNLWRLIQELDLRGQHHDASKLQSPEREVYAEQAKQLVATEYGGSEYQELLKLVQPAIDHHYANNRHHPEHWPDGIEDMDLVDIMEMLADWAAASKCNKNGNIHKSIEMNTERFKMTPQLAKILENTVNRYF